MYPKKSGWSGRRQHWNGSDLGIAWISDRRSYQEADEPTGALDSVSGRQIMELFSELNQEGMTVLMITHDAQIAGCADRMVMIKDGRLKDGEEQENGKE